MKNVIAFLMAVAFIVCSVPVTAKTVELASQSDQGGKLEALKGLKLRQHSGVIQSYNPDQGKLVIKNRKGEYSLSVTSDTQVKQGRKKMSREELKPGISVTVRYWENEGKKIARIVKLP